MSWPLPRAFDFDDYIDVERELWAFFPETTGRRVNFCQLGLTAKLFAEVDETREPLTDNETYFLMPCGDGTLRPVRMRSERALTLDEYRMTHLTAIRMMHKLAVTGRLMDEVHRHVLGPEIIAQGMQEN